MLRFLRGIEDKFKRSRDRYTHQGLLHVKDILELREEPLVDVRHLPDLVDAVPTVESRRDSEDTLIGRIDELLIDVLDEVVLVISESESAWVSFEVNKVGAPSQIRKIDRRWHELPSGWSPRKFDQCS